MTGTHGAIAAHLELGFCALARCKGLTVHHVSIRLVTVCLMLVLAASGARAQLGGGGRNMPAPPAPKEKEFVKRAEGSGAPSVLPAHIAAARDRSGVDGVLLGKTAAEGKVHLVRVTGAHKIEPDAVLPQIRTRVDHKPSRKVMQGDVERIYGMGLFEDVRVRAARGPSGSVLITYEVREKPSVSAVKVDGNADVSEEDILEVVDIKQYQVVDVPRLKSNSDKIKKLYVDKGFFLVEVDAEIVPVEDDDASGVRFVNVVFHVKEHAKVVVERIAFVGNKRVPSDDLKAVMRTREAHPLGIMTEWGTYKEEAFEIDLMAIEAVYQDRGFLNVQVGRPRVTLSGDRTRIDIEIPVNEGKPYRIGKIDVSGDFIVEDHALYEQVRRDDPARVIFSKKVLLDGVKAKEGDLFARSVIARDLMTLSDRFRDRGYAYVNVAPATQVDDENDTVGLVLQVDAGPRVTIERIDILGNTKTQDEVIRRELRVYEGELYSAALMRLSEQRVNALGFFETVDVTTKAGSKKDRMVVTMKVKEKSTGTFQVGAGFSSAETLILNGQISQNNFLGRGQTLSASLQWSQFRRIFDFRFVDPYAFYMGQEPVTFALSAFNTQRFLVDFVRNSTGGDLTLGYPIGRPLRDVSAQWLRDASREMAPYVPDFDNLRLFASANAERVEIEEQNLNVTLLGLQANLPRYTTSLKLSAQFDQRNNRLFPSAGFFMQASGEWALSALGSQYLPDAEAALKNTLSSAGLGGLGFLKRGGRANDFQRYGLNLRHYVNFDSISPLKGIVLKTNVDFGVLVTDDPTLIFEHYYLGGVNSLRGYFIRSIGPVQRVGGLSPDQPLEEFTIGGTKQLLANIELEFPLVQQMGVRGVLFFDAGNAYGANENLFYAGNAPDPFLSDAVFDPRRDLPLGLYYSAGFGVRWFSPIGPLRFEWGFPLTPRPRGTFGYEKGDDPYLFEFNIGNSF